MSGSNVAACPIALVVGLLLAASPAPAEEYWLKLVDQYGIRKEVNICETPRDWEFSLVKRIGRQHWSAYCERLQKYAVWDSLIFGTTEEGYFIFGARPAEGERAALKQFASESKWRSALAGLGVPSRFELLDPDEVAKTRSDAELHPWLYATMRGRWGLSDADWVGVIILFLAAVCFAISMLYRSALWPCAVLSTIVIFFIQWISVEFSDEGLTACGVGISFVIAGYLGRLARVLVDALRRRRLPEGPSEPGPSAA